jgi:Inactive homolog of metal-dependent proteases, putative molecular chaperone
MILYLNTANNQELEICLKNGEEVLLSQKIAVERTQAEKLLGLIDEILRRNPLRGDSGGTKKIKLSDIESIEVQNTGSSFTSLRVGVATANALGYALGIPVRGSVGATKNVAGIDIVEPKYDREAV